MIAVAVGDDDVSHRSPIMPDSCHCFPDCSFASGPSSVDHGSLTVSIEDVGRDTAKLCPHPARIRGGSGGGGINGAGCAVGWWGGSDRRGVGGGGTFVCRLGGASGHTQNHDGETGLAPVAENHSPRHKRVGIHALNLNRHTR